MIHAAARQERGISTSQAEASGQEDLYCLLGFKKQKIGLFGEYT
jgi:hypothetical protein